MYNADRRSMEFINGVHEFINAAKKHNKHGAFFHCPCRICNNKKNYSSTRTIHSHLFQNGLMPNHNVWTEHGKRGTMLKNDDEKEEKSIPDFADNYGAFFEDTTMGEPEKAEEHMLQKMILVRCCAKRRKFVKLKKNRGTRSIC